MQETTTSTISFASASSSDILSEILRHGAHQLLATAIQAEVDEWIQSHAHLVDANGRRHVVRNGVMPERTIVTGLGDIQVQQPRVHDRRPEGERERFTSKILPPYLRKTKNIEELIPGSI